ELLTFRGHNADRTRPLTIEATAFSRDGRCVASADWVGVVKLWDGETGQELFTLTAETNSPSPAALAFHPDGTQLICLRPSLQPPEACGNRSPRAVVQVFDVRTGKLAREVAQPTSTRLPVLSADGTWLVAFSPPHLRLWNTATGQELPPVTAQPVAVALNAD